MTAPKRLIESLAALSAVAFVLGCGGTTTTSPIPSGSGSTGAQAITPTPTTPAATTAAPSGPLAHKPTVAKGSGAPPGKLVIHDLIPGKGPAVKAGQTVSVQYVGVLFKTGKQFDASWDHGATPFSFTVGQGSVIPGWDQGLVGMHVGGRRQLVIPASLAYRAQAQAGIPPNSALIFDVDLLSAQ